MQSMQSESPGYTVVIQKTRRKKTIGFRVMADGTVQVSVPKHCSQDDIHVWIARKKTWIARHLRLLQQRAVLAPARQYRNGEYFYVLDQAYPLQQLPLQPSGTLVRLTEKSMDVYTGDLANLTQQMLQEQIKHRITSWYQETAQNMLTARTLYFAQKLQCQPRKILVKAYKSRWGCCSMDQTISYNRNIIMAPQKVIDYVIVHELCHIRHHHHGKSFWQAVAQAMPDYSSSRVWLKEHGYRLFI